MSLLKHRYSAVAIALHWIIAFAIFGMIALGWYMGDLDNSAPNKGDLYQLHKSIGIMILVLTIMRVLWRFMNKPPAELPMEYKQALIAKAVHIAFYVLMIAMPLTGWILVSASVRGTPTIVFDSLPWPHLPFLTDLSVETKKAIHPLLENAHGKLAWVAIGLLFLHVAGAVKHQFIDKDGIMMRMLPGVFGSTDGPERPAKGLLIALGGALAFFAIIVGAGIATDAKLAPTSSTQEEHSHDDHSHSHDADATAAEAKTPVIIPNWTINHEESKIGFSGIYNKKPFAGEFKNWSAEIQYNENTPDNAQINVIVETGSAETGDNYSDKSLIGPDFFDVKNHPQAHFRASGVFPTADGLELTAVLSLKGQEYPVRMPFTLAFKDNTATMNSTFSLDRLSLGLGVENDAKAEWISQTIDMNVHVVATLLE